MNMSYGYTVTSEDDPFVQLAEESSKISGWATAPGRWLVDYYPIGDRRYNWISPIDHLTSLMIVRHIPSFFPGAGWKRQGEVWRKRLETLSDVPHEWVKHQMVELCCISIAILLLTLMSGFWQLH